MLVADTGASNTTHQSDTLLWHSKGEPNPKELLGGSWVVINGVISPLIGVIVIVMLLITPLIITHEPPSSTLGFKVWGFGSRE